MKKTPTPRAPKETPDQWLARQKLAWTQKAWPNGKPADSAFSPAQKKHQTQLAFAMGLTGHFDYHKLDLAGIQAELLMMKALLKSYNPAKLPPPKTPKKKPTK